MTNTVMELIKLINLPKTAFKIALAIVLFWGLGYSDILSKINSAFIEKDLPSYSISLLVLIFCLSLSSIFIESLILAAGKTQLIIKSFWDFLFTKVLTLRSVLINKRATEDNYRKIIQDLSKNELDFLDLFNSNKLKLSNIQTTPMQSDVYIAHYGLVENKIISTKRKSDSIEVHTINPCALKLLTKLVFNRKKPCTSIEISLNHVLSPINSGGGAWGSR